VSPQRPATAWRTAASIVWLVVALAIVGAHGWAAVVAAIIASCSAAEIAVRIDRRHTAWCTRAQRELADARADAAHANDDLAAANLRLAAARESLARAQIFAALVNEAINGRGAA